MLSINNGDISKMMNYHRASDMINLIRYFPKLSPVKDLTIVNSIEDYNQNYDLLKDMNCERNDTLITSPMIKSIETSGTNVDIEDVFKKIKALDPDSVILLFNCPFSERYERYAGISVLVILDYGIFIEAVSQGFDGREVSKGITCHERYFIPWKDLAVCTIKNFKNYRTFLIDNKDYQKSREERIKFLTSVGLKKNTFTNYIPIRYKEIPDFIWIDVLNNLINVLPQMEERLKGDGLREFVINGHTEGKRYMPWQMYDYTRYGIRRD